MFACPADKSGQEGTTDRPTQEGTTMQQESGTSAPST